MSLYHIKHPSVRHIVCQSVNIISIAMYYMFYMQNYYICTSVKFSKGYAVLVGFIP